jgi:hypothetical protein
MGEGPIDKYQMAGADERERGFNRPVGVQFDGRAYRATLQYERTSLTGESPESQDGALHELVRLLQERGYRQLRSQLSFRTGQYLGNQEPWFEYADPEAKAVEFPGFGDLVSRFMRLFGRAG